LVRRHGAPHGFGSVPRFARRRRAPEGLKLALQALWWDAKGDWDRAHALAQADEGGVGDWVHAYLHRKEGDAGNAAYWYRRAGKPASRAPLAQEWAAIASALLEGRRREEVACRVRLPDGTAEARKAKSYPMRVTRCDSCDACDTEVR
jgi:hypothetical protein